MSQQPESPQASPQQIILASLISQIATLHDILQVLSVQSDHVPTQTEHCLMQLVSTRLNETAATAYYLEGKWRQWQAL